MSTSKRIIFIVVSVIVLVFATVAILSNIPATVRVSRTFKAPPEKVWQVWIDPQAMKQWWSPKNFTAPVIENNAVEGGKFLFSMKAPDGKMYWNAGVYKQVIPMNRLVMDQFFSDEHGNKVPAAKYGVVGNWPDVIEVIVEFQSVDDGTQVSVTEAGIPAVMYLFAKLGWYQQFDKFELLLR